MEPAKDYVIVAKVEHKEPVKQCFDSISLADQQPSLSSPRKKSYAMINDQTRRELIEAVLHHGMDIKKAAQKWNVNISTAKAIVKTFLAEGRIGKKKTRDKNSKIISPYFPAMRLSALGNMPNLGNLGSIGGFYSPPQTPQRVITIPQIPQQPVQIQQLPQQISPVQTVQAVQQRPTQQIQQIQPPQATIQPQQHGAHGTQPAATTQHHGFMNQIPNQLALAQLLALQNPAGQLRQLAASLPSYFGQGGLSAPTSNNSSPTFGSTSFGGNNVVPLMWNCHDQSSLGSQQNMLPRFALSFQ